MKVRTVLPYIVLVFITVFFFYKTVFSGLLPVPSDTLNGLYHPWRDALSTDYPRGIPYKNFLITDPVRQQIPWRKTVMDSWKTGILPVFNTFAFSGAPLMGNIQSGALYPLNILFLVLDFMTGWTFLVMLQPVLSALFLYVYLRYRNFHELSAGFGALAWSFCGFAVSWLTWGTIVQTSLWIPLLLLSIEKIGDENGRKRMVPWIITGIFSLYAMFTAGHMQIAMYGLFISMAMVIHRLYLHRKEGVSVIRDILPFLVLYTVPVVMILPLAREMSALLLSGSRNTEITYLNQDGWFIPPKHLVQFVAPDFFGNPATLNYFGTWNYGELVPYAGIATFVFFFYALLTGFSNVRFWLGVFIVSMVFAVSNPVSKLPFMLHIPIVSVLQPTRLMVLIELSYIIIAARGFDGWLREKHPKITKTMVLTGLSVAGLWMGMYTGPTLFGISSEQILTIRRNLIFPTLVYGLVVMLLMVVKMTGKKDIKKYAAVAVCLVLIADLFRFGWKFTPFTDKKLFFPKTSILSYLQNQSGLFRVVSSDERLAPANTLTMYGLETAGGYDSLYSGRMEEFIAAINRGKPDVKPPFGFNRIVEAHNTDSPLLPFTNYGFILSLRDLTRPGLTFVMREGETRLYRNESMLPRIYLADLVKRTSSKTETIEYMHTLIPGLKAAVVETETPLTGLNTMARGNVTVTNVQPGRFDVVSESTGPGILVALNAYHRNWHAYVDGRETGIMLTNYAFQGIAVPQGKHDVRFEYQLQ